jgi:hypothetical protein
MSLRVRSFSRICESRVRVLFSCSRFFGGGTPRKARVLACKGMDV